ncbi:hypothetical protein ACFSTC_24340 [Nonomuraea ferruginea]
MVTRGAGGASLALADGTMLKIPAPVRASGQDPCGAGDRLAGAAALAMRAGAGVAEAVITGVGEASRFVAGGGAAAVRVQEQELGDRPRTAVEVAELVRASGGSADRHRRLLRPAARRARQPAAAGPRAR